jgi:hypothetical protein
MGCGGSKDADADKKIDSEFKTIGLEKLDDIFSKAHDILESCETIRAGLEDTKEDAEALAHTYKLQNPKFVDSLQILLWALSVEGKGKIKDVGLKVGSEVPYLQLDGNKCMYETMSLYECFSTYIKTVVASPQELASSIEKLGELATQVPDAVKNAKADLDASGMNFKQKADALIKMNKNAIKLPKEVAKCKNLATLLKDAAADLKELVPKLPKMVDTADEEGAKIHAKNLWRLGDIFDEAHKGERKQEADLKKQEKKIEKKNPKKDDKDGKDGKKDDKKDDKKDKKDDKKEAKK